MTPEVFSWDWKAQPPMREIFAAAARASSQGRIAVMRMVETGDEPYACVVADRAVTDAEAEEIMAAQVISLEDLEGFGGSS